MSRRLLLLILLLALAALVLRMLMPQAESNKPVITAPWTYLRAPQADPVTSGPPISQALSEPLWDADSQPNILLISIDTLRRDHLGCYGYPRDTTPAIDRLCSDGVVYEDAAVPVPKTTPSLTSLLSGLYPKTHGVLRLRVPIDPGVPLLPQLLQERGYATAGFCGQYNCHRIFGFGRGFDTYDDEFAEEVSADAPPEHRGGGFYPDGERRAADLVDAATAWLARQRRRPFFVWIHFMDPHAGYSPPAPYDSVYSESPPGVGLSLTGPLLPLELIHHQARVADVNDYSFYVNLYDGEIRYLDSQIERLMTVLRRRKLYDDTLIILTSDHGEYMGESSAEQEVFSHGDTVFDTEILAPLVVKLPQQRAAGTRVSGPVSVVDVTPSLVPDVPDLEGRPLPAGSFSGAVQVVQIPWQRVYAVRDQRRNLKVVVKTPHSCRDLIAALRQGKDVLVSAHLYDLDADPLERNPMVGGPAVAPAIDALARWLVQPQPLASGSSDPLQSEETAARLRALGYLQ